MLVAFVLDKKVFAFCLLILFAWLSVVQPVQAATCHVPEDFATIQTAVDDPACTEIQVGAGTFQENILIQRDVVIRGQGGSTFIDGSFIGPNQPLGAPAFIIPANVNVALKDMIIQNGRGQDGGCIFASANLLTIDNAIVQGCRGKDIGGAILNSNGNLVISNTFFTDNFTNGRGGVITMVNGELTLENSTLFANRAGTTGGAIDSNGATIHISGSSINSNPAGQRGGGIHAVNSVVTIHGASIVANHTMEGGGVYNQGSLLTITQSTIEGHSATRGAGIYNASGVVEVTESLITGNGGTDGVGIYAAGGDVTIQLSTFSNQGASSGSAIGVNGGSVYVTSSGFYNNYAFWGGGAVTVWDGEATVMNSSIQNNIADDVFGVGAAFRAEGGSLMLDSIWIDSNTADSSGALGIVGANGPTVELSNTVLTNNQAANCSGDVGLIQSDGTNYDDDGSCEFD